MYVSLSEVKCVYEIPEITYKVQNKVTNDLKELFEELKFIHLDIKSTIWIAGTKSVVPANFDKSKTIKSDEIFSNIKINLSLKNYTVDDFIGPDMDIGFRVAKYAFHHKVTLSSDFAYLLLRMKKPKGVKSIDNNIKIVSFEILKGVWQGHYYPILWYYPNWKSSDKDFYYSDHKENNIVENVLKNRYYPLSDLEKVYEELGKTDYIDNLIDICISKFLIEEKDLELLEKSKQTQKKL